MTRRLALAAACALAACSDDERRHLPPPPDPDSGPERDSGPWPDASTGEDAGPDSGDGSGSETVHRDYGTDVDVCPEFQIPLWGDLDWTATIPEGASIHFSAQAAAEGASLSHAERVTLGTTPPATPPIYVAELLPEEHRNDPQLRINAQLRWPAPDVRPTLDEIRLNWRCLDRE